MNSEKDIPCQAMQPDESDDMQAEYDFSGGIRGKYYKEYQRSHHIVELDPEAAELFTDSASGHEAHGSL